VYGEGGGVSYVHVDISKTQIGPVDQRWRGAPGGRRRHKAPDWRLALGLQSNRVNP
jgi:hypothetical protein